MTRAGRCVAQRECRTRQRVPQSFNKTFTDETVTPGDEGTADAVEPIELALLVVPIVVAPVVDVRPLPVVRLTGGVAAIVPVTWMFWPTYFERSTVDPVVVLSVRSLGRDDVNVGVAGVMVAVEPAGCVRAHVSNAVPLVP